MYTAIIFTALFATQANASSRISDGQEFGTNSGFAFKVADDNELKKVVEGAVANIDRIVQASWTPEQKLTAIHETYKKVQFYRTKIWSRSPVTEQKLDLLIRPYESFPQPKEFRKQNCKSYYSIMKTDWEPTATAEPTLEGVKHAWDNLKAICKS